jgi:hypothetical protein
VSSGDEIIRSASRAYNSLPLSRYHRYPWVSWRLEKKNSFPYVALAYQGVPSRYRSTKYTSAVPAQSLHCSTCGSGILQPGWACGPCPAAITRSHDLVRQARGGRGARSICFGDVIDTVDGLIARCLPTGCWWSSDAHAQLGGRATERAHRSHGRCRALLCAGRRLRHTEKGPGFGSKVPSGTSTAICWDIAMCERTTVHACTKPPGVAQRSKSTNAATVL